MTPTQENDGQTKSTGIAILTHVIGIFLSFFFIGFVYFRYDDEFVRKNAVNALNWHLPVSLLAIPTVVLGIWGSETAGVAVGVTIASLTICFALIAAVKAYRGQAWKYPVVPRVI